MIHTSTPFRISFFGGGTDYKPFFDEHGGSVLSTTIDKYCYSILRPLPPFFEYRTQIRYAKTESVKQTEDIEHPLVKNCMKYMNEHNLSIVYDADLPARSGLGTSSSFAVGLLQGMYALKGKYAGKQQLASDAIYVERTLCNESGGLQDQIAAAYGGFNRIDFNSEGFSVNPVVLSQNRKQELENHLMLFFTGISRMSHEAASAQSAAIKDNTSQLLEMKNLVETAEKIICSQSDISEFGKLLDYTWKLKRGLNKVSNDCIDDIYRIAKDAGASGGKLLGAGGGGFMVIFASPDAQIKIKKKLENLIYVPFLFENEGSKIIHYTPEKN